MTNAELIELLKQDDPNAEVHVERYIGERRWVSVPRNATNGEIMCSLYPDEIFEVSEDRETFDRLSKVSLLVSKQIVEWWKAPYKRGE